jgi:hypothetical protein
MTPLPSYELPAAAVAGFGQRDMRGARPDTRRGGSARASRRSDILSGGRRYSRPTSAWGQRPLLMPSTSLLDSRTLRLPSRRAGFLGARHACTRT